MSFYQRKTSNSFLLQNTLPTGLGVWQWRGAASLLIQAAAQTRKTAKRNQIEAEEQL